MGLWSYLANSSQPEEARTGVYVNKNPQVKPRVPAACIALFLSHKTSTQEKVCIGSSGKAEIQMNHRDWDQNQLEKMLKCGMMSPRTRSLQANSRGCVRTKPKCLFKGYRRVLCYNCENPNYSALLYKLVFFFSFRCYSGTLHPWNRWVYFIHPETSPHSGLPCK